MGLDAAASYRYNKNMPTTTINADEFESPEPPCDLAHFAADQSVKTDSIILLETSNPERFNALTRALFLECENFFQDTALAEYWYGEETAPGWRVHVRLTQTETGEIL